MRVMQKIVQQPSHVRLKEADKLKCLKKKKKNKTEEEQSSRAPSMEV